MSEKLTLKVLEDRLVALGERLDGMLDEVAGLMPGLEAMMNELEARVKALERLAVVKPGSDPGPMMNELEARIKALEARPASRSAARVTVDPVRAAAIRAFAPGYARAHKGCTYEEAEAAYDAQQAASAAA